MLSRLLNVLTEKELATVCGSFADEAFQKGAETAGYRARRVKNNEQLKPGTPVHEKLAELVLDALERHAVFQTAVLPRFIHRPLFSRYGVGMEYGTHVDDALMGRIEATRTDVAVTVFLSDPGDYQGGELILQSPFGETAVKLPQGDAVAYPANTLHRVAPVTYGERLAAVTWAQSHVRDPSHRELLYDLHQIRHAMHEHMPDAPQTSLAFKTYSNLLRQWAET